MPIIKAQELNLEAAQAVGGQTGSKKLKKKKDDGFDYQYKPPISENKLHRRMKSDGADSENFGELLAARIASQFDPNGDRVPQVDFVMGSKSKHLAITSKYLKADVYMYSKLDNKYIGTNEYRVLETAKKADRAFRVAENALSKMVAYPSDTNNAALKEAIESREITKYALDFESAALKSAKKMADIAAEADKAAELAEAARKKATTFPTTANKNAAKDAAKKAEEAAHKVTEAQESLVTEGIIIGKVQSLDDYFSKKADRKKQKVGHIKLVSGEGDKDKFQYNIDEEPKLKKELAKAIALSALLGDHDVNPGNMIVMTNHEGKVERIGRIDYGHAFRDLMRHGKFGGQQYHTNNIIDFFNRATVDGINPGSGSKSKLWRDYPGLIPSREMADALKELAETEKNAGKIHAAVKDVQDEVMRMLAKTDNKLDKKQIIRSFHRMAEQATGGHIHTNYEEEDLPNIFKELENFCKTNLDEMAYAAQVMDLQVSIQEAVRDNKSTSDLEKNYEDLLAKNPDKPFPWIKESASVPAFEGNFDEFVQHLQNLNKIQELTKQVDTFLESKPSKHEAKTAGELKAILTDPKASAETKMASLQTKINEITKASEPKTKSFKALLESFISRFSKSSELASDNFKSFKNTFKDSLNSTKSQGSVNDYKKALDKMNPSSGEADSSRNLSSKK